MAAEGPSRYCPSCDLAFPLRAEYELCPGCMRESSILLTTPLPDDWEAKLKDYFEGMSDADAEDDRIVAHRIKYLIDRANLPVDSAVKLGTRFHGPDYVDIHYVEDLVTSGCPPEVAVKIAS